MSDLIYCAKEIKIRAKIQNPEVGDKSLLVLLCLHHQCTFRYFLLYMRFIPQLMPHIYAYSSLSASL